jgi:STE24 endopeptidase
MTDWQGATTLEIEAGARAREYSRLKERLTLAGMGIGIAAPLGFVLSGLAARVNRHMLPEHGARLWQRGRYAATLSLVSSAAALPLGYYSGYVVEHRYGLSKQTTASWARDQLKATTISLPVELVIVEGAYAAIRRFPRGWWLVCAGAVVPLSAVFAQLFPVLIAPRFNRYEPLRDPALSERMVALAARAGVPIAGVMQMDMSRRTTKTNAFFAGLGRTKRIVLADTLLEQFTPEEIEGVVAHEAAHQVHHDIWRFVALSGAFTLATGWVVDNVARRILRASPRLAATSDLASLRSLPLIGVVLTLTGLALAPLQLAYSRAIERRSDGYAVDLTGNPAAYAGALRKLAVTNLADPSPPRLVTLLLHSHPPLAERIAAAEHAARAGSGPS